MFFFLIFFFFLLEVLLTDFYIDQNLLILSIATRDYSIPSSYAKNLLRLNIYNMFYACVINNFQLNLFLV